MYPFSLQGEYQIKILVFNWRDPKNPDAGGAEQYTHQIEKRWVKWGHEVTQFSAAFDKCLPEEVIDGVKIVRGGNRFTVYRQARKFYHKAEKFDVVVDEINTIPFGIPSFVNKGKNVSPSYTSWRENSGIMRPLSRSAISGTISWKIAG